MADAHTFHLRLWAPRRAWPCHLAAEKRDESELFVYCDPEAQPPDAYKHPEDRSRKGQPQRFFKPWVYFAHCTCRCRPRLWPFPRRQERSRRAARAERSCAALALGVIVILLGRLWLLAPTTRPLAKQRDKDTETRPGCQTPWAIPPLAPLRSQVGGRGRPSLPLGTPRCLGSAFQCPMGCMASPVIRCRGAHAVPRGWRGGRWEGSADGSPRTAKPEAALRAASRAELLESPRCQLEVVPAPLLLDRGGQSKGYSVLLCYRLSRKWESYTLSLSRALSLSLSLS